MKITKRQLRRIIREVTLQEKKGLWDNVHNKRKEGRAPAKKGDDNYPDEKAWKAAQETDETDEEILDELDEIDCWDGYGPGAAGGPKTKEGTGKNKGKRVNNCEKRPKRKK